MKKTFQKCTEKLTIFLQEIMKNLNPSFENKDYRNAKVLLLLSIQWKPLQFTGYVHINVSTEYFVKLIDNYYTSYTT